MKRNTKDEAWLKEFSRRIKARMEYLKINQKTLVRLTGIPKSTINYIVRGSHVPLTTHTILVARALLINPSELIDFEVNA